MNVVTEPVVDVAEACMSAPPARYDADHRGIPGTNAARGRRGSDRALSHPPRSAIGRAQTHEGAECRLHHARRPLAPPGGTEKVESSTTPLDQTFAQATLPTQTTFDPGHPAAISL
jgi:hypothetical protein